MKRQKKMNLRRSLYPDSPQMSSGLEERETSMHYTSAGLSLRYRPNIGFCNFRCSDIISMNLSTEGLLDGTASTLYFSVWLLRKAFISKV